MSNEHTKMLPFEPYWSSSKLKKSSEPNQSLDMDCAIGVALGSDVPEVGLSSDVVGGEVTTSGDVGIEVMKDKFVAGISVVE